MKNRLMAVEVWFLQRMLQISWTEKKSNLEVLRAAGVQRTLMNAVIVVPYELYELYDWGKVPELYGTL